MKFKILLIAFLCLSQIISFAQLLQPSSTRYKNHIPASDIARYSFTTGTEQTLKEFKAGRVQDRREIKSLRSKIRKGNSLPSDTTLLIKCVSEKKDLRDTINEIKSHYEILLYGAKSFHFFPVNYIKSAQWYYNNYIDDEGNNLEFVKNSNFNIASKYASLYTEFVGGYVGPVRMSLGGLIQSSAKIDTSKLKTTSLATLQQQVDSVNLRNNTLSRLLGGGGNALFLISYPFLDFQVPQFRVSIMPYSKIGAVLPQIGSTGKFSGFYSTGEELYVTLDIQGDEAWSLFLRQNISAYLPLSSDYFYNLVGFSSSLDASSYYHVKHQYFAYNEISLGMNISNTIRIMFTKPMFIKSVKFNKDLNSSLGSYFTVSFIPPKRK